MNDLDYTLFFQWFLTIERIHSPSISTPYGHNYKQKNHFLNLLKN
jgi:hypothetical protein